MTSNTNTARLATLVALNSLLGLATHSIVTREAWAWWGLTEWVLMTAFYLVIGVGLNCVVCKATR